MALLNVGMKAELGRIHKTPSHAGAFETQPPEKNLRDTKVNAVVRYPQSAAALSRRPANPAAPLTVRSSSLFA